MAWGQTEELRRSCAGSLSLPPIVVEMQQAPQDREELPGFPHLLAQLLRPGVGVFDFGGCKAFGEHKRCAQGNLQAQRLLATL